MELGHIPDDVAKYMLKYIHEIDLLSIKAVSKKYNEFVKKLLEHADFKYLCIHEGEISSTGGSMRILSKYRHKRVIEFILQQPWAQVSNIQFNLLNQGLYGACRGGHIYMIEFIMSCAERYKSSLMIIKSIDILYINIAFEGACIGGHLNAVKFMIEHGANDLEYGLGAVSNYIPCNNPLKEYSEIYHLLTDLIALQE